MRASTAEASETRISNIQPDSYGSVLTVPGSASSVSLTATISPSSGEYRSLTDFVDSTSPHDSPAVTVSPRPAG